ncbi:hypothetical protein E2C01_055597 [Portunus trituberculatus]|uniref:Uncharacterized protein n=1 Tax=Portunus trituberculatus TaxID=210409 RepID=A0A5B7GVZ5_PORTR|nr:hypothetical protein [Portunus trituberculatus]
MGVVRGIKRLRGGRGPSHGRVPVTLRHGVPTDQTHLHHTRRHDRAFTNKCHTAPPDTIIPPRHGPRPAPSPHWWRPRDAHPAAANGEAAGGA